MVLLLMGVALFISALFTNKKPKPYYHRRKKR